MDQATVIGQIRYDAFGNVVAQGGDPVEGGDIDRRSAAFAEGYGIQPEQGPTLMSWRSLSPPTQRSFLTAPLRYTTLSTWLKRI